MREEQCLPFVEQKIDKRIDKFMSMTEKIGGA